MNHEQVRRDQAVEGQRRILSPNRPSPSTKKPFVAKGHDAILKGMQDGGEQISVALISSDFPLIGKLVARDKFTITVLTTFGRRTIYKHAIESFGPFEQVQ